ncbi:hypothetical protein AB0K67_19720 [Nonomuraea sp. NPDC052634]|uniref:hypothetical protein n=1 Tax=Nonomuraea sp. NPDC052634 TaxID=3155813 RepID=UPI00341A19E6
MDARAAPDPGELAASIEEYNAADEAYWEQYHAVVYDLRHSTGLLYLGDLGCARWASLVVSGPARGQMWGDHTADGGGFFPLVDDDGRRMGFARWYRRWLDEAEEQVMRDAR